MHLTRVSCSLCLSLSLLLPLLFACFVLSFVSSFTRTHAHESTPLWRLGPVNRFTGVPPNRRHTPDMACLFSQYSVQQNPTVVVHLVQMSLHASFLYTVCKHNHAKGYDGSIWKCKANEDGKAKKDRNIKFKKLYSCGIGEGTEIKSIKKLHSTLKNGKIIATKRGWGVGGWEGALPSIITRKRT